MAGVILGNWTHRRGDAGGSRALAAEVAGARPRVAWSWSPPHGGRVDQVRVAGELVYVATQVPVDPAAVGWEHAVVYAIDAARGTVVAHRTLADPAPVAAMVIEGRALHLVATRPGEPVFWYALATPDLVPVHRRVALLDHDARQADVLDAWASPDGGLWLEIEAAQGDGRSSQHSYSFLGAAPTDRCTHVVVDRTGRLRPGQPADACAAGRALLVPVLEGAAPSLRRLDPGSPDAEPLDREWMRTDVEGDERALHAVFAEGAAFGVALAHSAERVHAQVVSVDGESGVVRLRSPVEPGLVRELGVGARVVRRANRELVVQRISVDGAPCSDLLSAMPDGSLTAIKLGAARPYLLDLALGDALVAHRSPRPGRVIVGAFAVVKDGAWLGRRTSSLWSLELPSPGDAATVYAGAGHVFVRSPRGLTAIRM
jgi:hypothetical protein